MHGKRNPALLFDKLADSASIPFSMDWERDDLGDVKTSIRRELAQLLSARRPIRLDEARVSPPETVLDYGLPDWTTVAPGSHADRRALERATRDAILLYEPRLHDPVVELIDDRRSFGQLTLVIHGKIAIDDRAEAVSFPIAFRKTVLR
jgi:type VI secretion system lysozyme-like protein